MKPFLDAAYPYRAPVGMPMLPQVYAPSMTARRRPRRDNADVAWTDQAINFAGQVAGPAAVAVLTFILSLPMVTP